VSAGGRARPPANETSNGTIGKVQLLSFAGESDASEPCNLALFRGSLDLDPNDLPNSELIACDECVMIGIL
jgi:hypothetical protein